MASSAKLVSVIIPAYNAAQTIAETLDSVFKQSYRNLEVIVVNDGSTDATLATLENYPNSFKIISTENKGVSHARSLGFKHSNGDYIQYLDADDLLVPGKIELQVQALTTQGADVAYGDWQRFEAKNARITITETIERKIEGDLEIALFTYFWCPPAVILYSRRICESITWNENLPVIQDARYFLDAAIAKGKFTYTKGVMALYRTAQSNSLSQKSELNFVLDCYANGKEIFELWNNQNQISVQKKEVIIDCLRYCIHEFRKLDKSLFNESINFLLKIEPKYIPKQKGLLRFTTKIFGYKNAELLASLKGKIA